MDQGRTQGAAARGTAPLLRQRKQDGMLAHQRYLAAPGYHPVALVIAALGPAVGAAVLAGILAAIALGLPVTL